MFKIKLNETNEHTESDWLVLDKDNQVVAHFATTSGAERWIDTREVELAEDLLNGARQRRDAREAARRLP